MASHVPMALLLAPMFILCGGIAMAAALIAADAIRPRRHPVRIPARTVR